jgi:ADP-heptose:LPS heptosyltransferase
VRVPVVNAAGDTDIGQLAALFAHADLALGPDSGPLHLAAAVGTPTVRLFGPASVEEFGPWGDRQIAITSGWECAPCRVLDWSGDDIAYHPCVRDIDPNPVIAAARRLLG